MLQVLLIFLIITQAANVFGCPLQSVSPHGAWRAATYRGLKVGKSSRADMLRVLGKPLSSGPSADQDSLYPIIWNDYGRIAGELSGTLAVEIDTRNNRLVSISIAPDRMTKQEAIRLFGNDYLLMGYEFCKGLPPEAEVGPIYEDPKSSKIDYLEYRSKGIALHLDHQGIVDTIYYVAEPIGVSSKAGCKKALESYGRKSNRR
jgi:hypothetical protein